MLHICLCHSKIFSEMNKKIGKTWKKICQSQKKKQQKAPEINWILHFYFLLSIIEKLIVINFLRFMISDGYTCFRGQICQNMFILFFSLSMSCQCTTKKKNTKLCTELNQTSQRNQSFQKLLKSSFFFKWTICSLCFLKDRAMN